MYIKNVNWTYGEAVYCYVEYIQGVCLQNTDTSHQLAKPLASQGIVYAYFLAANDMFDTSIVYYSCVIFQITAKWTKLIKSFKWRISSFILTRRKLYVLSYFQKNVNFELEFKITRQCEIVVAHMRVEL